MYSMFSELIFSLRIWGLLAEVVQELIHMIIGIQELRVQVAYC